jgi:hypothetical protein
MASPIIRLPLSQQPPSSGGFNSDVLPRPPAFCYNAAEFGKEKVTNLPPTARNATFAATLEGIAARCAYSQTNVEWSRQFCTTSDGAGTGDFTMIVLANPASATGVLSHVLAQKNDAGGSPFAQAAMMANANSGGTYSSGSFAFFTYNALAGTSSVAVASMCDGNFHVYIGVRQGTNHILYRDGVQQTTSSLTVRNILQSASRYTAVGSRGNGTTEAFSGDVPFAMMLDYAITPDLAARISANVWSTLAPMPRMWLTAAPAAGAGFQSAWAMNANSYHSQGASHAA